MKHEINLSKYLLRTDLMDEILENTTLKKTYKKKTYKYKNIKVTDVFLDKDAGKIIGKKEGRYITIFFDDATDEDNKKEIKKVFLKKLKTILPKLEKDDLILVVGLGNRKSTPDSLGPKVVEKIRVTNHLYKLNVCLEKYQKVATFEPGVTGETGIETSLKIKGIINEIKPKLIIAIDALASGSINRLNKTIQITDTGIEPGSGIGNKREGLNYEIFNIPVLAIGVPTVVDASSIVYDTINYMHKKYSFSKYHDKKYLLTYGNANYLEKNIKTDNKDKEKLLGLVGKLDENELRQLINEVLNPIGYNLMVTTKEIDFLIDNLSEIIVDVLNSFFEI